MNKFRWLLGMVCVSLMGSAFTTESGMEADNAKAITQTLHSYEVAWSEHDAHAIASFYHEPSMRVSQSGGPTVRATLAMQEAFFSGFLPSLVAQGYSHSTWEHLEVHLLDDNTAIASGIVVRLRSDKSVFQRQAVT